ncbi:hypothetical protein [Dyadobacter sp. MSC1_007]|jgi:hypothetical protein|uniref:hypothetical protein n=1 Tax=Dyadobacter sp. MSC1_007 TaxID=2909264 RepID=UPI00202E80C7|nr:hypothetical protein [Dyadobacter sp. MSC1_007]
MNTETHALESTDSALLAYGKEVRKLLSSSNTENWSAELWTIFTGYIISLKDQGHAPELCDTYFSFKELLDFFERVERIGRGEMLNV